MYLRFRKNSLSFFLFLFFSLSFFLCGADFDDGLAKTSDEKSEVSYFYDVGEYGARIAKLENFCQTSDGKYMVVGSIGFENDSGNEVDHVLLLKMDIYGNYLWNGSYWKKSYKSSSDDVYLYGEYVYEDSGGNFLIGGLYQDNDYSHDFEIAIKVNESGGVVWSKRILIRYYDDLPYFVKDGSDGITLCVTSLIDENTVGAYVLNINSNGSKVWGKGYYTSGLPNFWVNAIIRDSSGDYLIVGHLEDYNSHIFLPTLLKITSEGAIKWCKSYGPTDSDNGWVSHAVEVSDGYLSVGYGPSDGTLLLKCDKDGNFLWAKEYKGVDFYLMTYRDIAVNSDGSILLSGYSYYGQNYYYGFLMKLNSTGGVEWAREVSIVQKIYRGEEASDGGYFTVGSPYLGSPEFCDNSDAFIGKFDSNGEVFKCDQYEDFTNKISVTPINWSTNNVSLTVSSPSIEIEDLSVSVEDRGDFDADNICRGFPGDVNNDDVVDISDVILLAGYLSGNKALSDMPGYQNADYNEDGSIDAIDLCYLLNDVNGNI